MRSNYSYIFLRRLNTEDLTLSGILKHECVHICLEPNGLFLAPERLITLQLSFKLVVFNLT
jgi:hypothetical protein